MLDADRRKAIILADARNLALAHGLELVEDEGLLEEVAGLVEWPVTLMGEFEAAFLDIPPEVIRATIRANQKCFVLRNPSAPSWPGIGRPKGRPSFRRAMPRPSKAPSSGKDVDGRVKPGHDAGEVGAGMRKAASPTNSSSSPT